MFKDRELNMIDWLLTKSHYGIVSSVLGVIACFCAAISLSPIVEYGTYFTLSLLVSVIVFVLVHFILETYTNKSLSMKKIGYRFIIERLIFLIHFR